MPAPRLSSPSVHHVSVRRFSRRQWTVHPCPDFTLYSGPLDSTESCVHPSQRSLPRSGASAGPVRPLRVGGGGEGGSGLSQYRGRSKEVLLSAWVCGGGAVWQAPRHASGDRADPPSSAPAVAGGRWGRRGGPCGGAPEPQTSNNRMKSTRDTSQSPRDRTASRWRATSASATGGSATTN